MSEQEGPCWSQVVLIRPGETDYERAGILQGTLNVPLNAQGIVAVDQMADELWFQPPQLIYTSPTEPARATAHRLGELLKISVCELKGLKNVDLGLWQGMRWDDLCRSQPRISKCWKEHPEALEPPGGEMLSQVRARVVKALRRPIQRKLTFGIVLPEPLATAASCILQGVPLVWPFPSSPPVRRIERFILPQPVRRGVMRLMSPILGNLQASPIPDPR